MLGHFNRRVFSFIFSELGAANLPADKTVALVDRYYNLLKQHSTPNTIIYNSIFTTLSKKGDPADLDRYLKGIPNQIRSRICLIDYYSRDVSERSSAG